MKSSRFAEEEEGTPSIHIPIEVVEGILSRLPVKSLIRFQSACKLWHSIISDRRFRRIHYDSTHKNNLYWVRPLNGAGLDRLVKLDNNKEFKTEWLLESPFVDVFVTPTRTCNGILLMVNDRARIMGLWNPSIRKDFSWIMIPDGFKDFWNYAFYFDPVIDDYKIAVVSAEYYTIYSCKSASWSEAKPYPSILPARLTHNKGFNVNGSSSFYWLDRELGELVCFDFGDEKLSKLPLPNFAAYWFGLTAMSGRLCLLGLQKRSGLKHRLWLLEKHNHSWIELIRIKNRGPPKGIATPYVLTNEDAVVLSLERITQVTPRFLICNLRDKSLKDFKADIGIDIGYVLTYSESLNFPVLDIDL